MPPQLKVAFFFILWLVSLMGCSNPKEHPVTAGQTLGLAKDALAASNFTKVEQLVADIPRTAAEWQQGMLLAGEAATKSGNTDAAIKHYLAAIDKEESSSDGLLARFSAAEIYFDRCQLTEAEHLYRKVLSIQPGNGLTNERMAFLLAITGRRWQSLEHYFVLVKSGDADYRELSLAADVGRSIEQPEFLQKCARLAPNDKYVQLALAFEAFNDGKPESRVYMESVVQRFPEEMPAQAVLGEILVDNSDDATLLKWHKSLPAAADDSPDVWFVRGLWSRRQHDLKAARECFWQSVMRTPFHRRAYYLLGQTLEAMQDPNAEPVIDYSSRLVLLSQNIDQVLTSEGRDLDSVRTTTFLLEQLGRIWEACAWAVAANRLFPDESWPGEILHKYGKTLQGDLPRVTKQSLPSLGSETVSSVEFSSFLSRIDSQVSRNSSGEDGARSSPGRIQFQDSIPFHFAYFNADDAATKGVRTFEQTGGGVAVLDFDRDDFADVFFTQGTEWYSGSASPTPSGNLRDKLIRNIGGKVFRDVPMWTSDSDVGYGQGCASGDFNNDGFPDLYVANVGRNQLLQNQGDGTFVDITTQAGFTELDWTASCVIADLNADGFPDVFDVNYISGKGVYEAICKEKACSPRSFQGTPAQLHLNHQDGTFSAVQYGSEIRPGKGLGVVCLPIESQRYPSLFISNDQVANQLLQNSAPIGTSQVNLVDKAFVMGTAFNGNGVAMAGMGIAADDVDGNGTTDFYVSNFKDEPNTLFLQDAPGLFVDATNASGLKAASMAYVGWGTQFLDADRDSLSDLVLTNGHVDDYRDEGGEYHMRPQFFHQERPGRFVELFGDETGPFFEQKRLGRGLARLDWNQDGLMDFAVSNINDQATLVTNITTGAGHYVNVRTIATTTARDAIGTIVTVTAVDGSQWSKPLLAGDGYMASNERLLQFGLGTRTELRNIEVAWPSGALTTLKSPAVDDTFVFVEAMPKAFLQQTAASRSLPVEFRDSMP